MKFVILDANEVGDIVFSEILETHAANLRYNIAETQTVVKYEGSKPRFLYGKETYTYSEIITIMATSAWSTPFVPSE